MLIRCLMDVSLKMKQGTIYFTCCNGLFCKVNLHSNHGALMKIAFIFVPLLALAACSSLTTNNSGNQAVAVSDQTIIAFQEICLKTAPSFSGAEASAKSYGISEITDAGFMKMGFNADHSLSIQIQSKECAITSPSKSDNSLTKQFLAAISEFSKSAPHKVPAIVRINDQSYMVIHDRKGGEAYVIRRI